MRAVLQRVTEARVKVEGVVAGEIGAGLLVLLGVAQPDTATDAEYLAEKILNLRIFADDAGKMNRSVVDVAGGLLFVSQFTLAADTTAGNRPSFAAAAPADLGLRLYERIVATARRRHSPVEAGIFGADMEVHLVNDGPVTIPLTLRA